MKEYINCKNNDHLSSMHPTNSLTMYLESTQKIIYFE
jgi:hypothetical protein